MRAPPPGSPLGAITVLGGQAATRSSAASGSDLVLPCVAFAGCPVRSSGAGAAVSPPGFRPDLRIGWWNSGPARCAASPHRREPTAVVRARSGLLPPDANVPRHYLRRDRRRERPRGEPRPAGRGSAEAADPASPAPAGAVPAPVPVPVPAAGTGAAAGAPPAVGAGPVFAVSSGRAWPSGRTDPRGSVPPPGRSGPPRRGGRGRPRSPVSGRAATVRPAVPALAVMTVSAGLAALAGMPVVAALAVMAGLAVFAALPTVASSAGRGRETSLARIAASTVIFIPAISVLPDGQCRTGVVSGSLPRAGRPPSWQLPSRSPVRR